MVLLLFFIHIDYIFFKLYNDSSYRIWFGDFMRKFVKQIEDEYVKKYGYRPNDAEIREFMNNNPDMVKNFTKNNSYIYHNFETNGNKKISLEQFFVLLWFVSSLISLVYFSSIENMISFFLVIFYYIFFFVYTIKCGPSIKQTNIVSIIGFLLIALLFFLSIRNNIDINISALLLLLGGGSAVGISFFFIYYFKSKLEKNTSIVDINALIKGYNTEPNGSRFYILEYEYNGIKYNVCEKINTKFQRPIGSLKKIRVCSLEPDKICYSNPLGLVLAYTFFGIIFILGFFMIAGALFSMKIK